MGLLPALLLKGMQEKIRLTGRVPQGPDFRFIRNASGDEHPAFAFSPQPGTLFLRTFSYSTPRLALAKSPKSQNPVGGATGVQYTRRSADGIARHVRTTTTHTQPRSLGYIDGRVLRRRRLRRFEQRPLSTIAND